MTGDIARQHLRHLLTRHVKGGEEVDRDVIDGGLVVEQYSGRVHVVALGRHVQGRQAVLREGTFKIIIYYIRGVK